MNDMNNLQLSLFRGVHDTQPRPITIEELVTMMRADQSVRDLTEKHRYALSLGDKQGAKRYKHMMASFGVAARFEGGRQQKHIVEYTGLSLVDIDHIAEEDMARVLDLVRTDEHTLLAYTTLSGQGLRILFRYALNKTTDYTDLSTDDSSTPHGNNPSNLWLNNQEYKQVFEQGNEYYCNLLSMDYDHQCKNTNRISTIAHDEQLYYNPEAVPFVIKLEEKKPIGRPKKGKSGEGKGKSDNPDEAPLQALAVAAKAIAKVEAQGIRYEEGTYNKYVSTACYEMNRHGVPEEECREWAAKWFADYDTSDVEAIVRSCYQQTDEHGTTKSRRTAKSESRYASVEDIEEFLTHHVDLRYNTVSRMVEIRYHDTTSWKPLEDKDLNSLWRMMNKQCGMRVIKDDMYSIMRSDYPTTYNPFEEYIQSLPAWDGTTDHIARLASSVTVESDANEWYKVFRKWFVGFIAAIFSTEEVNHEILVFIGEQGKYKSTWFYYLLPEELRRYFLIKLMDGAITRDDLFNIAQSGLVCLEEIDNMKQKELNQLKALTTMRTINVRRPYGRFNEVLPHIASFCATGNNRYYLTDRTANRRFLTFEVKHIETPQEYDYQYAGLYAQAYALWQQGFRYWFDEKENRATNERNQAFEAPDSEYELVTKYYRRPMQGEPCKFLTASDVLERLSATVHSLSAVKIGLALGKLGTPRVRLSGRYGYRLVELTPTDIETRQRIPDDYSEQDSTVDQQTELPF